MKPTKPAKNPPGRPKLPEPNTHPLSLKITEAQFKRLKDEAKKAGLKIGKLAREKLTK